MKALMKWGCICIYALGFAFCLFSCLSVRRAAIAMTLAAAGLLVAHVDCLRKSAGKLWKQFEERPRTALAAIFILGVIVRVCFALSLPEGGLWRIQNSDARYFWGYAHEMASGAFPDVKSWTHTFLLSLSIRLFGNSLVPVVLTNTFLQFATSFTLYMFARKTFSQRAAILSAATYLLAPSFIRLNFCALTESCYFFLLSLAMLALSAWIRERNAVALLVLPVLTWMTIWTRGEAVLLPMLALACLAADAFFADAAARCRAMLACAFFCCSCLIFAALGYAVNAHCHGTCTPMCSNDSWWPRLYGSNVASRGRVSGPRTGPQGANLVNDKILMYEQYRKDHANDPNKGVLKRRPMQCPKELIPYIKAEIERRWKALSITEKINFVIIKEWLPWNNPYMGRGQHTDKKAMRTLYYDLMPAIAIALCAIGLFRRMVCTARSQYSSAMPLQCLPLLYLFGIVCAIAIAESNIRYGVIALLVCPLYAFPGSSKV